MGRGGPPLALVRARALTVLEGARQASLQQGNQFPPASGAAPPPILAAKPIHDGAVQQL